MIVERFVESEAGGWLFPGRWTVVLPCQPARHC